jgi:Lon protease-like protein
MDSTTPWRAGFCDFAAFAGDLAQMGDEDFPRDRLLAALKTYLSSRDMKADWKSVMTAPGETLVNALAMMCPFDPAEKQALLEAQSFQDRASTLMALLEMGGEAGSTTLN